MTGDADLKYAALKSREFGKIVFVTAIGSRFPFGIATVAENCFVYDVGGFFREKVLPAYRGKPKGLVVRELLESARVLKAQ